MAIDNLNTLQRGDIVIVDYGAHGHTMVVTQKLNEDGERASIQVAHCPGPQQVTTEETLLAVCPDDVEDEKLFAWWRPDSDIADLAATLATAWSTQAPTLYGDLPTYVHNDESTHNASRSRGVAIQYDHGKGGLPELGYDALFRIFKWAHRSGSQGAFSENRGTTCCSFVMACHQAASLLCLFFDNRKHVKQGYELLRANRGAKLFRQDNAKDKATRKLSNVGTKNDELRTLIDQCGIQAVWKNLLVGIAGEVFGNKKKFWGPSLADCLTPALEYDAKFTYTLVLKRLLGESGSGWIAR